MTETGHIKNVEHFQQMIAEVQGYDGTSSPTRWQNSRASAARQNPGLFSEQFSRVQLHPRADAFDRDVGESRIHKLIRL